MSDLPDIQPTPEPSAQPTPELSAKPTPELSAKPTPELSAKPTSELSDIQGECLCGECTIKVVNGSQYEEQTLCHCWDCKRTSGSAFSGNIIVPEDEIKIEGSSKEFKIKAPSGNMVTRVFCSNCGSALSHFSAAFGNRKAVQTGNFLCLADKPITLELWTKDRWAALAPIAKAVQFERNPGQ